MHIHVTLGDIGDVTCRQVVPFLEGPLLEVLLYMYMYTVKPLYNVERLFLLCPLHGGSFIGGSPVLSLLL